MLRHFSVYVCLYVGVFSVAYLYATRPLFEAYPTLRENISHIELTDTLPTPLVPLKSIGERFFTSWLYCKDDAKTGPLFGGNKVRKLEFLLADALANRAQAVVTLGAAGSNHALATAAYANQVGLCAYLLLTPQKPTQYARRNLLMDAYFKATIEYFATCDERNQRLVGLLASKRNYYIPVGGSNELGAIGFVNAVYEFKQQCDEAGFAYPEYLYVPYGSFGTISGILVGIKAAGIPCMVVGVATEQATNLDGAVQTVLQCARAINDYLCELDSQFPAITFSANDVCLKNAASEYAEVTPECRQAMLTMRETENIQLDTTYSGKAFAALLNDLENDESLRGKRILFWKTYADGDYADVTACIDYKDLPAGLHSYFEEPLQPLDDQGC